MTKELYWLDSYQQKCESTIKTMASEKLAVVDQTVFYPQGGGQPTDTGILRRKNEEFRIVFTKKVGPDIALEVDRIGLLEGETIETELDWNRRYKLMRMHTSAHILAKIIFDETGSLITGNQMDAEQSRMDFNVTEFNAGIAEGYIEKANKIVQQKLEVTATVMPYAEAMKKPELFRLKDVLPKTIPELRIVSIGKFDVQADGGTHVRNTKETGKLELQRIENKGKENRRIYWTLEQ
jgi:misacylated tRNA(Ala) deacylase